MLRKLKPKIPDHNDAHPVVEDMRIRKDAGLRQWRKAGPYPVRRRTAVDYRFHTKEQQDFYETILLDKKPIVITSQVFMTASRHVRLTILLAKSSLSGMMS